MKKIEIQYFICLLILIITLEISCKKGDWYEAKSDKSLAVPSTLKDMQALLDYTAVFNANAPCVLREIASDGHYVSNEITQTLNGYVRNAYVWSNEETYENVPDWLNNSGAYGGYRIVYTTNIVLEGLDKIKLENNMERQDWNNIKGQALFHRAAAFYDLSQTFVPRYEKSILNTQLGVPLRLESDINIPSKRSTVKETYDQIIKDLILAKDLLPASPLYRTRPSKQAVYAILARIYLSMEQYEQAAIYADECLNSYNTLMDYNQLDKATTANPIISYNPEVIFYSYISSNSVLSFDNILIDNDLYDSYQQNDLRKKIFFNYSSVGNLVTYKGTYSALGIRNCFSGLATDEIYLIRAECYARGGKISEAMMYLNNLLKKRWFGAYTDLTAVNSDQALRLILEERKKELILRGLRWSDLRRLNNDPRFAITLTRTLGGKSYTLEPNSYKYTFPIPNDIIKQTGMEQNPVWE